MVEHDDLEHPGPIYLEDVKRLDVRDGDTVVITLGEWGIDDDGEVDTVDAVTELFREKGINVSVLILGPGSKIGVLGSGGDLLDPGPVEMTTRV